MRNIILLLITISFSVSSYSQTEDSITRMSTSNVRKPSIKENSTWENGTWNLYSRYKYKYSNNNIVEVLEFKFNLTDTLSRTKYFYDSLNRIKIVTTETYDSWDSLLKFEYRYTYTYSNSNSKRYTIILRENYNTFDFIWKNNKRDTYVFNSFDHTIEVKSELFTGNTWVMQTGLSKKTYYEYLNALSNKITLQIDSVYTNNLYKPIIKRTNQYNNAGIIMTRSEFNYLNGWDTVLVEIVENNANGIPINMKSFSKVDQQSFLTENLRYDSLLWDNFDNNKSYFEQTPISHSSIQRINNQFNYVYKFIVTKLDTFGSKITTRYDYSNGWILSLKNVNIYDNERNITLSERLDYVNNNWVKMPGYCYEYYNTYKSNDLVEVITKEYDNILNSYVNTHKTEYIDYISTNINTSKRTLQASLYPNPNSDGTFHIDIPTAERIELYNLQGQLIRELKIEDYKIEINNVPNGLYSLVIYTNKGISRTKIAIN